VAASAQAQDWSRIAHDITQMSKPSAAEKVPVRQYWIDASKAI
jgi:hypothetical protein